MPPCYSCGAWASTAPSCSPGHGVGNPREPEGWPPPAVCFLAPCSKICVSWKHPSGDKYLKTVATSFILCDYSHLLPQIKAARIYGSPTWDKRNRVASRYGTDADTKARQSQSPPQTCCEEVTHLSRMVRLLSFHCILNCTHVVGQQQGLQASFPRNHSQQRLH